MTRIRSEFIRPAYVAMALAALLAVKPTAAAENWIKLKTTPYTLNNKQDAIAFADAKVGWYGNGTGRVYRSTDAGATWKTAWSQPGTYVRALEFIDSKIGFLGNIGANYYPDVSDGNPLYVTRDGGETWTPAKLTSGMPIVGVCAIDALKVDGKIVAIRAGGRVGGPAGLLESFDEGRTWRARDMRDVTGMVLDIRFVDDKVGFIAGATDAAEDKSRARILKTSDGGATWRTVFESDRQMDVNWKLAFPSSNVGYATIISYQAAEGDARGYVAKTEDGGETWRKMPVTRDKDWVPFGIAFLDEKRGWVGGSTGGLETRDGGATWSPVPMGLASNKIRVVKKPDGGASIFAIGQDVYRLDVAANN